MKKIVSLLLAVAMAAAVIPVWPVFAYESQDADETTGIAIEDSALQEEAATDSLDKSQRLDEYVNGTIPVHKDVYVVDSSALHTMSEEGAAAEDEFPASYRSDEQAWAKNVRVKNQKDTSICWAFGMTSAAEYSYAKELYEQTGELYDGELSPGHIAQFFYNRINDPLGNTERDYNGLLSNDHFAIAGGNQYIGMQHLATWSGPVSESEAPLEELEKHIIWSGSGYIWDGPALPYPSSVAYGHNELT